MDNIYLKTEMKPAKSDVSLLKARFTYGLVLVGLGLLQQDMSDETVSDSESEGKVDHDRTEDIEERVERVTKALAPIILPMIESLGAIDVSEVESTTASGEST